VPPQPARRPLLGAAALGNAQGYLYRMMILMVLCRNSIHRMRWMGWTTIGDHSRCRTGHAGRLDKLRAIIRRRRG